MTTTPLSPADHFHVGLVVPDMATAAQRVTAATGYTWTKPIEAHLRVTTSDGEHEMPFSFVYSIQAPHLELIQEVPGTIWSAPSGGAAHHLGFWTDDLAATARGLQSAGYRLEACPSGDDLTMFAYLLDPAGIRIEIIDRALFPDWPRFLQTMTA